MLRAFTVLSFLTLTSCSTAAPPKSPSGIEPPTSTEAESEGTADAPTASVDDEPEADDLLGTQVAMALRFAVGDYRVRRYTGTFSDTPMTLTERVTAIDGAELTREYELESASGKLTLRVRSLPLEGERILSVARVVSGAEQPGTRADLEALFEKTEFIPDENEGAIDSGPVTCLVGEAEFDCQRRSFRVRIGEQSATLELLSQDGDDVDGEISADDGTLIYRAQVTERGNAAEQSATSVASR